MFNKLTMQTKDLVQGNVEKIAELFPNCVTEKVDNQGKTIYAVDFEALKRVLSNDLSDEKERYSFTWPGKTESQRLANCPITYTLRPVKSDSVDYDYSKNIYIEGDNLDVLKILRETYLGKVKMVYIDPPYNTGSDFVYQDNFKMSSEEYSTVSGGFDENGNCLELNTPNNGRFHTDWLNMIYPRLLIAKDLLSDEGVICISIDDRELHNLLKVCNEIFGERNFIANLIWKKKAGGGSDSRYVAIDHEYIVVFAKNESVQDKWSMPMTDEQKCNYKLKDVNYSRYGPYKLKNLYQTGIDSNRPNLRYPIKCPDGTDVWPPTIWRWSKETFNEAFANNEVEFVKGKNGWSVYSKMYLHKGDEEYEVKPRSILSEAGFTRDGNKEVAHVLSEDVFSYPKPVKLIKTLISFISKNDGDLILDFFSGSATTGQAVLELNKEDGIQRNFILVQLPERLDTPDGNCSLKNNKTICGAIKFLESIGKPHLLSELGKERLRRVINNDPAIKGGFRVFKQDSSNMSDVYYNPNALKRNLLDYASNNIKSDRTREDLLIQVMLELGIELSASIVNCQICGKDVFDVDNGYLIACFDEDINDEVVTAIAKQQPRHVVFRDSSMKNDAVAINFEQIFKVYSPNTQTRVL